MIAKVARKRRRKANWRQQRKREEEYLDGQIDIAEDDRTVMAKSDPNNIWKQSMEGRHCVKPPPSSGIRQTWRDTGYALRSAIRKGKRLLERGSQPHVKFTTAEVWWFDDERKSTRFEAREDPRTLGALAVSRAGKWIKKKANKVFATFDTGADDNYITENDRQKLQLPIKGDSSKQVSVANGHVEQGKHETELPLEGLSPTAKAADSFESFHTTLISGSKVVDDGNTVILDQQGVKVYTDEDVLILVRGKPIMIGTRDSRGRFKVPLVQHRGQWQPRVPSSKERRKLEQANSVYDLPSIEQAIKWMHAVCGFPVKSTWLKAIKAGNYHGWPLLTVKNVKKYYPETVETAKGHMSQTRKNKRSTKAKPKQFETAKTEAMRGKKVRDVYIKVYDTRETTFSDQTGQFPKQSRSNNKYIMVMVEIDSNAILVEPMTSRKDKEMQRAYKKLMARLKRAGIVPKKHVLDNKVSDSMKELIQDEFKMEVELVPPSCHRRNAAEVAICNFKCHFLSILAGVADDFPLYLWDRLLPQAEITLNLLRQSNATPTVSAYAHLCGPFDYNKMPLAPMGSKVQIHEATDKRGTCAYHSIDGWYFFTSPKHYRTHVCHAKATKSERLSDTVKFFNDAPEVTPEDKLMQAIQDQAKILQGKCKDDHILRELEKLQNLTKRHLGKQDAARNRAESKASSNAEATLPRVASEGNEDDLPRVPDPTMRVTRAMSCKQDTAKQVPRVASPPLPSKTSSPPTPPTSKPAQATTRASSASRPKPTKTSLRRSTTATAPEPIARRTRASRRAATGPAANTRSRTAATKPAANAVEKRGGSRRNTPGKLA